MESYNVNHSKQDDVGIRLIRIFLFSAGVVLMVTAVAKLGSALGRERILGKYDPLFAVSYRTLFILAGILEMAASLGCLFVKSVVTRLGLVAWLATMFVIYRFSLNWIGYVRPCPCLGSLTAAIHLSPQVADTVLKGVLAYLLLGGYGGLLWLWLQIKKVSASAPIV
ncbi:MAG TPA: hypothetical protein VFY06_04390 [Verrucomicrobiae bacterium]|nr:hypothetical protein [Verrucomicrobiae bacterium]